MRSSLHLLSLLAFAATAVAQGAIEDDPRFVRGRALFDRAFHRAQGLGSPDYNGDSCRACHQDPRLGGAGALELNVSRFGRDFGGSGPFTNLAGGQASSKFRLPQVGGREEYPVPPSHPDVFEQRQPPALFGIGLIETIQGPTITANEDTTDANGDGIFGVARRINMNGTIEIGRYGWKAQIALTRDFVHDALAEELGITTPDEGRHLGIRTDVDDVADPEVASSTIDDLDFFLQGLPAPQRGGSTDPRVAIGEALFTSVGCAKCHKPSLQGQNGPVPLYSNLLLHNVMPSGFRGMAEPGAGVGLYRTPPLWGIKDTAPYLHDGRAETLEQAIAMHSGEAVAVTSAYVALSAQDKQSLLLFLKDL